MNTPHHVHVSRPRRGLWLPHPLMSLLLGASWLLLSQLAIMGALALYLNFINMFVFLLSLFGGRE